MAWISDDDWKLIRNSLREGAPAGPALELTGAASNGSGTRELAPRGSKRIDNHAASLLLERGLLNATEIPFIRTRRMEAVVTNTVMGMRMLLDSGSVQPLTPVTTVGDPLDFTDTRDYRE
jgi:hypothetical protein